MTEETVLTTRRAVLLPGTAGRLRVSDRWIRFDPWEGGERVEVLVVDLRAVHVRRRTLEIGTAAGVLRLRCFGVRGVAALLEHARAA